MLTCDRLSQVGAFNNPRVLTLEKDFAKKWATYWLSPKRHGQPR